MSTKVVDAIAAAIDGNQYGQEVNKSLIGFAKDNNCIIAFGYSDDNLELRGAVTEEIPAYDGVIARFIGLNHVTEEIEQAYETLGANVPALVDFAIHAYWDDQGGPCWIMGLAGPPNPCIQVAKFNVYEDKEHFCEGMVFQIPKHIAEKKLIPLPPG